MGRFSCSTCGGDFYLPLRSTFPCPNCNIDLHDQIATPSQEAPTEYLVVPENSVLENRFAEVLGQALALWRDRQAKYGPSNIAATGALGCYVRANDKLARLGMVYLKGLGREAADESVKDSWLDLLNYAAMGLMCEEHTWPGT